MIRRQVEGEPQEIDQLRAEVEALKQSQPALSDKRILNDEQIQEAWNDLMDFDIEMVMEFDDFEKILCGLGKNYEAVSDES